MVLPILAISWSSWTKGNLDTSDVPDEDDSSFQQLKQCKSCQITNHSYGTVPSILEQSLENVRCRPDWSNLHNHLGMLCVLDLIGPYTIKGNNISHCNRL